MDSMNSKQSLAPATQPAERPGRNFGTIGRVTALVVAGAFAIGIMVGPIIADNHATAADTTGTPEHLITVSGSGVVTVTPDTADVYLGVSVTRPTAKDARSSAASQMTAVVAAIKKLGIADKDIATTNVSLSPVYDYTNGTSRLTGYQFGNTVKVTVRDLAKVADVIDDSVNAGATTVNSIAFRLNDPKPVEAQARTAAMTDARNKADALAKAAGVSIKGVAAVTEVATSSPIYYQAAMDSVKASGASTPIQTGTTDVQISVTVAFLI
jgi:uncharacterized protein